LPAGSALASLKNKKGLKIKPKIKKAAKTLLVFLKILSILELIRLMGLMGLTFFL